MKDYADERLWATSRRRWRLKLWWSSNKITILIATAIILYLLASWFDEQDRRAESENRTTQMAMALASTSCMSNQPAVRGYLIASDHPELADEALQRIVLEADRLRTARVEMNQALREKR